MKVQNVAIIGLGRVGASIALAFKKADLGLTIIGHDRDRQIMKQAQDANIIDKSSFNLVAAAADGDIVIVAEPFIDTEAIFQSIGPEIKEHAILLDMGPLKGPVQKWADAYVTQGHYVGVMPIPRADAFQDGRAGIESADADYFRNSVLCLMPGPKVAEEAVQTATKVGVILGAEPYYIDAAEYDTYAQALETMPALLAAAFFRAMTSTTGWGDMRKMAGLPFAVVTQALQQEATAAELAFQDKQAVLHWIDTTQTFLSEMRRWVSEGDRETLGALLTELNIQREEWLHERRENNWNEISSPNVDQAGAMQQLFGGFLTRRLVGDENSRKNKKKK